MESRVQMIPVVDFLLVNKCIGVVAFELRHLF